MKNYLEFDDHGIRLSMLWLCGNIIGLEDLDLFSIYFCILSFELMSTYFSWGRRRLNLQKICLLLEQSLNAFGVRS